MRLKLITAASACFFAPFLGGQGFLEMVASSSFVERGLKLGNLSVQPSLEYSLGDGYLGFWGVAPLERSAALFSDYDLYGGYGWKARDKWAVDLGAKRRQRERTGASLEAYLGMVGELGTVTPSFHVFRDFDLDQWSLELATALALPLESFPFESSLRVGVVAGDRDYLYHGVDLYYPVELDFGSLSLGLHYAGNDFGGPEGSAHFHASLGFAVDF